MQVTTSTENFEDSITALRMIHSGSTYKEYLEYKGHSAYKICSHAFYLLRMLREMCMDAEYSRDLISDTIAPIFRNDLPGEKTDKKMVAEIKKQIREIDRIGLMDEDYKKKRV